MPIIVSYTGRFARLQRMLNTAPHRALRVGVVNNSTVARYAKFVEYGWTQTITKRQAGWFGANYGIHLKVGNTLTNPPRPFIRGTYQTEWHKWTNTIFNTLMTTFSTELALRECGDEAVEDIRDTLRNGFTGSTTFAPRSPLTMATALLAAEAGGHRLGAVNNTTTDKPLVRTGNLLTAIGYELSVPT